MDNLQHFLNKNELVLTERNKRKFSEVKTLEKVFLSTFNKKLEDKKIMDTKPVKNKIVAEKMEKNSSKLKNDKLPFEKSEEKKILSMIYDGNATEVVENWNNNSSGYVIRLYDID